MSDDLNVAFPKPCSEDWAGMETRGCHRHCESCDKIVHDLSKLTADEAEALLRSEEEVCVRAEVDSAGRIRLADSKGSRKRRLLTAAGASMSLSLAACQTLGGDAVTPLYVISGETSYYQYDAVVTLTDANGMVRKAKVGRDKKFRFGNLRPGNFTLSVTRWCGDPIDDQQIVVTDDHLSLGTLEWGGDQCIIVGVMVPAEPPRRG